MLYSINIVATGTLLWKIYTQPTPYNSVLIIMLIKIQMCFILILINIALHYYY
jgi:hypothetical protein